MTRKFCYILICALLALTALGCAKPVTDDEFFSTLKQEAKEKELAGFPKSTESLKRQSQLARAKDKDGNTALLYVAHWTEGQGTGVRTGLSKSTPEGIAFMELLLNSGADVKAVDSQGRTALHRAAEGNSPPFVKLLVSKGAEVNAKDKEGRTPLDLGDWHDVHDLLKSLGGKSGSN